MIDNNPAVIVKDATALVYESATGSVLIQRIQPRKEGGFTGIETLQTFNTPEQLAKLRNACLI